MTALCGKGIVSDFSDFPIVQCPPGPSDAELQADRDAKHAQDVAKWNAQQGGWNMPENIPAVLELADLDHIPARAIRG